jgi:hypothetical protein
MSDVTTRAEHLALCRAEALRLCDQGAAHEALKSLYENLEKHPGTAGNGNDRGILRIALAIPAGRLSVDRVKQLINLFR